MLVSVHAISSTGGHCDDQNGLRAGLLGYESRNRSRRHQQSRRRASCVRYNVKYGADVIKVCATGGVLR